jgi:hypothetical protein
MNTDEVVTGITVCWNYLDIIKRSYESIRKFHPYMKLVIVDGSTPEMPCYQYLDSLVSPSVMDTNLTIYHTLFNIGHGKGMDLGIKHTITPFALIFDSDIEMVKSPVQAMLDMMETNTFGVGYTELVGLDGHDYGVFEHHKKHPPVKYLHPYFQLIQIREYKKYKPYIHHGAPCVSTMIDIHRRGLSNRVLKEFPGLGHTNGRGVSWKPCAGEYVKHEVAGFGGTGRARVAAGLPHIEGAWEAVR